MHQYKGRLLVHTGSMFSGKTSSLEREIKRFRIAGYATEVFKPNTDTRFRKNAITSHDDTHTAAVVVDHIGEILQRVEEYQPSVIAIDEVQFLGGEVAEIIEALESLLKEGKTVVVAGLDMDFEGRPFDLVKELMVRADYVDKHHAVCARCGSDGWISHRITKEAARVVIGASETYEPLCRNCYIEVQEGEN
ncbi:MAG: thymidine kinase [Tissierellia bacterium]|nr:thymidine kinase [Tissierellia bacterium]